MANCSTPFSGTARPANITVWSLVSAGTNRSVSMPL